MAPSRVTDGTGGRVSLLRRGGLTVETGGSHSCETGEGLTGETGEGLTHETPLKKTGISNRKKERGHGKILTKEDQHESVTEDAEAVVDAPEPRWQNPKSDMAAAMNVYEARAQKQVWLTPMGCIEVAGDFRTELEREFPLVDLKCGLAQSAPNVRSDGTALAAMQTIRREFGFSIERNATHGSDAPDTAEWELSYFYKDKDAIEKL